MCTLARLRPTLVLGPLYGRTLGELAQTPAPAEQPEEAEARAERRRRFAEARETARETERVASPGRDMVPPSRGRASAGGFHRRRGPALPARDGVARDRPGSPAPAHAERRATVPLEGRRSTSRALRLAPQAATELLRRLAAQDAAVAGGPRESAGAAVPATASRPRRGSAPAERRSSRRPLAGAEAGEVRRWRATVAGRLARRLVARAGRVSTQPVTAVWWSEAVAGERAPGPLLRQLVATADAEPAQPPAPQQAARRPEPTAEQTPATEPAAPPRPAGEDPAPPGDPTTAALQRREPRAPLWPPLPAAPSSLVFELAAEEAGEDDLGVLADRLARILREEARRHGVDV